MANLLFATRESDSLRSENPGMSQPSRGLVSACGELDGRRDAHDEQPELLVLVLVGGCCAAAWPDWTSRNAVVPVDEPSARAELLLLSPSVLVPRLTHGKVKVWDMLAIAEYLNEIKPEAKLWPADPVARAHARACWARSAFGTGQVALGPADEPQGALSGLQGLGRRRAASSVWMATWRFSGDLRRSLPFRGALGR